MPSFVPELHVQLLHVEVIDHPSLVPVLPDCDPSLLGSRRLTPTPTLLPCHNSSTSSVLFSSTFSPS